MKLGTDTITLASADPITKITISPKSAADPGFFGAGGPSVSDIVDIINPLEHIPFVSVLFDSAMEHKPSTVAQLAGGALLGGPIGFVASLANVIFESATGQGFGETIVAALTGDTAEQATQFAANNVTDIPEEAVTEPVAKMASAAASAPMQLASAEILPPVGKTDAKTVLDLYGGSTASAHNSYRKAQMLPYLHDVSVSQVL